MLRAQTPIMDGCIVINSLLLKTWFLWVTNNDALLADYTVKKVKYYHPEDEVIVITDGSFNVADKLSEGYKVINTNFPKWLKNGDNFLHNRYKILLENSNAELFIKIDPDSVIHKRINIPEKSDWFGQVYKDNTMYATWGCGMGLRRHVIEKLINTPLQNTDYRYESVSGEIILSEDSTLGYYLSVVNNYVPEVWKDVKLCRISTPCCLSGKWSITHPSLGKRINQHNIRRIVINRHTEDKIVENVINQLYEERLECFLYSYDRKDIKELIANKGCFKLHVNTEPKDPKQLVQTITLEENGLLTHNNVIFCDPQKQNIMDAWYSNDNIENRENLIKKIYLPKLTI